MEGVLFSSMINSDSILDLLVSMSEYTQDIDDLLHHVGARHINVLKMAMSSADYALNNHSMEELLSGVISVRWDAGDIVVTSSRRQDASCAGIRKKLLIDGLRKYESANSSKRGLISSLYTDSKTMNELSEVMPSSSVFLSKIKKLFYACAYDEQTREAIFGCVACVEAIISYSGDGEIYYDGGMFQFNNKISSVISTDPIDNPGEFMAMQYLNDFIIARIGKPFTLEDASKLREIVDLIYESKQ